MSKQEITTLASMGLDTLSVRKQLQEVSTKSDDPDRQVGAVIYAPDGRVVSASANKLVTPRNEKYSVRTSRVDNQKYYWIEHAERGAIFSALKNGIDLSECLMAVSLFPCADCARAIIQAGIPTLLAPRVSDLETRHQRTMFAAIDILSEARIRVLWLE
ncbi:deaminase [Shimia haliotis]|uniref:deaminase n=1 Tax=Shimia haliotis TaxID=1280847 RepID=UPI000B88C602|nr:deaminase [Shimia haliotis]